MPFILKHRSEIKSVGNNCGEKKEAIENRFDVAKFGPCNHPTSVDADAYALTVLLPQALLEGAAVNIEVGHKTVKNKVGPISYNTYLSYAAGDQLTD